MPPLWKRVSLVPLFCAWNRSHTYTLFGVCRYNISSNQVNSYLNIMRFNWCIMVFILLLVKANKILVRLTSIRSFVSLSVRFGLWMGNRAFRIAKREPHLVKKNYGNFVKWNKNKCKKAQQSKGNVDKRQNEVYKTSQSEARQGKTVRTKKGDTHKIHRSTHWTKKQSNNTAAVNTEHVDSMKKTLEGDENDGKTGATGARATTPNP